MKDPFSIAKKYLNERAADPEPERPDAESLTAMVLAEFQPDEAGQIMATWRDLLGVSLDSKRVTEHLHQLRAWQKNWP